MYKKCVGVALLWVLAYYSHLRSASQIGLPRTRRSYGDRSFALWGSPTWNSLPALLRSADVHLGTFMTRKWRRCLAVFVTNWTASGDTPITWTVILRKNTIRIFSLVNIRMIHKYFVLVAIKRALMHANSRTNWFRRFKDSMGRQTQRRFRMIMSNHYNIFIVLSKQLLQFCRVVCT